jgi:hypothetical protein
MGLTKVDLITIERIVKECLEKSLKQINVDVKEMKTDVKEMKDDLRLLATINQLEEIKKDGRLRSLYVNKPQ